MRRGREVPWASSVQRPAGGGKWCTASLRAADKDKQPQKRSLAGDSLLEADQNRRKTAVPSRAAIHRLLRYAMEIHGLS